MAGLQRERSHGLPDSWLHQNGRRSSMQDGQLSQFEQPKLKITLLCLKVDGLGRGFGERVETFFSPRMWHHAGRPTTGHSTETIGKNSQHNGRRTITRKP